MNPLPGWLRRALFATAAMNVLVGVAIGSGAEALLASAGLPAAGNPFYPETVGLFVLLFGIAYLGVAWRDRACRAFIAWSGAGKLAFVALVASLYLTGHLPLRAPLVASADLLFGALFVGWSLTSREARPLEPSAAPRWGSS